MLLPLTERNQEKVIELLAEWAKAIPKGTAIMICDCICSFEQVLGIMMYFQVFKDQVSSISNIGTMFVYKRIEPEVQTQDVQQFIKPIDWAANDVLIYAEHWLAQTIGHDNRYMDTNKRRLARCLVSMERLIPDNLTPDGVKNEWRLLISDAKQTITANIPNNPAYCYEVIDHEIEILSEGRLNLAKLINNQFS